MEEPPVGVYPNMSPSRSCYMDLHLTFVGCALVSVESMIQGLRAAQTDLRAEEVYHICMEAISISTSSFITFTQSITLLFIMQHKRQWYIASG